MTARGLAGCGASCVPQAATVEVDAHVVFAGTRIASAKPSRTLYYYRTRLGSVVATSYRDSAGNSSFGAGYRYTPYGEVELSVNETDTTRSELGYTNALRLTGSLLYLKNRVYDTRARVFIQADTVDRLRYAYVMGDPVNLSDPSGLLPIDGDIRATPGFFAARTTEREAAVEHAKAIERAEQQAKTSEAQTARESEVQKEAGTALHNESTLDKVTSAAASTTQKLADYSVNDKNPLVLRGLVAFAGGVTSLFDRESIGKTGLTLGIGVLVLGAVAAAPALLAASPEAAAGGGAAAAAAASPAGQRAIVTAAEQANRLHHIFDNAGHRLGPLVEALGSQQAALGAVERATQAAARSQGLAGVFKTTVQVAGQEIVVKGKVIDGVARIGSFWRQP